MKLFHTGFNNKGRTENVLRNINVAMICQVLNTLLGFVSRSFFITMLGKTYLGVNGIFGNILTILNFAELGIGTAIVYNLYKPLKEHDELRVSALVNFYKKAYFIIGTTILVVGLTLTPFLHILISDQPDIKESISLLYVLYLASTVSSYVNAHKKSLLGADQKQHITSIYHQVGHTIQIVLQMLFLYFTHNYIVYLLIQITCRLLEGWAIAREADRLYPFLKSNKHVKAEKGLISSIKKDVGALTIYKLNHAVIHGTDNILITALSDNGVQTVGLYANYTLITETINTLLGIITNALTPSLGNLNVEKDVRKKESIFYTTLFLCTWLYGFACCGVMSLSDLFITSWLGEEFLLAKWVVFATVLQLYIRAVHFPAYTYRITCGLFTQSKYVPILTSIINLFLSIYLGTLWGLFGILFATSVARIITIGISDPYLVYKHIFKKNPISYYLHYLGYSSIVLISYFAADFICNFIHLNGWLGFFISFTIFTLVFNLVFIACTFKTRQFKDIWAIAAKYLKSFFAKLVKS